MSDHTNNSLRAVFCEFDIFTLSDNYLYNGLTLFLVVNYVTLSKSLL